MTLWFFTDTIIQWTRERLLAVNTPELGGGVDGAEAMTVGLCQHLARLGHDVTHWVTHCEAPGQYGAVRWRSVEQELRRALLYEPSPDVFVSVRRPDIFSLPEYQLGCKKAFRLLWTHDVYDEAQRANVKHAEAIVYMSRWHREEWERADPSLASGNFFGWLTPAAFEPSWLPEPTPTDNARSTFLYGSRPERGLGPLLEMWPEIRRHIPDAMLLVTGYTAGTSSLVRAADAGIAAMNAKVGGIEVVRSPDKRGFYKQLRRARLLLYPGVPWFTETNGHICSEAMVCGAVPVVTRIGALEETIPPGAGVFIDGDASTPDYQKRFIDAVVAFHEEDEDSLPVMRQRGAAHVMSRCSYDAVADLWNKNLRQLPVKKAVVCQI